MIENPPLLQIRRRFPRPAPADIGVFVRLPTGYVVDALGGGGALDGGIKPIGEAKNFCGVALTCHAGPSDNLATFGALSVAAAGDVIVSAADGYDKAAVTGDLLLGMMKN